MRQITYYCDVCTAIVDGSDLGDIGLNDTKRADRDCFPVWALEDVCSECRENARKLLERWVDSKGEL